MVMPIGIEGKDTMFEESPFDLHEYIRDCNETYGVPPRPHWATTYYGGHVSNFTLFNLINSTLFN